MSKGRREKKLLYVNVYVLNFNKPFKCNDLLNENMFHMNLYKETQIQYSMQMCINKML